MRSSERNIKSHTQSSTRRHFAPFVANILKPKGSFDFPLSFTSYDQKHNLIITAEKSLQFYNASTLRPSKNFQTQKLDLRVMAVSYCPDTEVFIIGCNDGSIYTYNLPKKALQELEQCVKIEISRIMWINSSYYAFSAFSSDRIFIGNRDNGNLIHLLLPRDDFILDLKNLPKRNILLAILGDSSVRIYRTDQLPKLQLFSLVRRDYKGFDMMLDITIKGKDFLLTTGSYSTIEIWHFTKGRMRRIKVIRMPKDLAILSFVYLENEKMIVTAHRTKELRFWKVTSGKLECTLDIGMDDCFYSFTMQDKNAIGAVSLSCNLIKIVKLYECEDWKKKALGIFKKSKCCVF